ncbi:hypothetical protein PR202_gb19842 [Eleusine coracana subsp. coracana]|uniref:Uncharacterized protein n=1 Tax=Eleusine coracana subsp. coracana TaxID=191504 RepID=A0AAV5F8P6_ELECO|nr:hypothetical protein PR202_gb19842 [Eleusine coracana subsp. coracana]
MATLFGCRPGALVIPVVLRRRGLCRVDQDDADPVWVPPPFARRRKRRREPRFRPQRSGSLRRRLRRPRSQVRRQRCRVDQLRVQPKLQEDPAVHGVGGAFGANREHVRAPAGPPVRHPDRRPVHRGRLTGPDEGGPRRRRGPGFGDPRGVPLRERAGRGPGHRRRLLHRQQRHVPAPVQHGDHDY